LISRILGKLDSIEDNYLIIEVNNIFYQIFIPKFLQEKIKATKKDGDEILIYTLNYIEGGSTGNQRPRLVGFLSEIEKEFFERYITVKGLGERKALKSLTKPISVIAKAIEFGDKNLIKSLPGIGSRMADMITAELKGKMSKFALLKEEEYRPITDEKLNIREEAKAILSQLGYKYSEINKMIEDALIRKPDTDKAEDIINIIFKSTK